MLILFVFSNCQPMKKLFINKSSWHSQIRHSFSIYACLLASNFCTMHWISDIGLTIRDFDISFCPRIFKFVFAICLFRFGIDLPYQFLNINTNKYCQQLQQRLASHFSRPTYSEMNGQPYKIFVYFELTKKKKKFNFIIGFIVSLCLSCLTTITVIPSKFKCHFLVNIYALTKTTIQHSK